MSEPASKSEVGSLSSKFARGETVALRTTMELGRIVDAPVLDGGEFWYRVQFGRRVENLVVSVGPKGKIYVSSPATTTRSLAMFLRQLKRRQCADWRESNAAYFDWHLTHLFLRMRSFTRVPERWDVQFGLYGVIW